MEENTDNPTAHWPELCETEGCNLPATYLFGMSGDNPCAFACCIHHMNERVIELKQWAKKNGHCGQPVLMPRCQGAEDFYNQVNHEK